MSTPGRGTGGAARAAHWCFAQRSSNEPTMVASRPPVRAPRVAYPRRRGHPLGPPPGRDRPSAPTRTHWTRRLLSIHADHPRKNYRCEEEGTGPRGARKGSLRRRRGDGYVPLCAVALRTLAYTLDVTRRKRAHVEPARAKRPDSDRIRQSSRGDPSPSSPPRAIAREPTRLKTGRAHCGKGVVDCGPRSRCRGLQGRSSNNRHGGGSALRRPAARGPRPRPAARAHRPRGGTTVLRQDFVLPGDCLHAP